MNESYLLCMLHGESRTVVLLALVTLFLIAVLLLFVYRHRAVHV